MGVFKLANDASKIYFAPKAQVYMAETTATMPTDLSTALDPAWKDLGYVTEDGISITPQREFDPVNATQSASPVKYVLNSAGLQLKFVCMEMIPETVELYFGATWTTVGTDKKINVASNPPLAEKALVIEYGDYSETGEPVTITGNKNRLVIPRGMVSDVDETKVARTDTLSLGITFDAMDQGGSLGYLLTNAA